MLVRKDRSLIGEFMIIPVRCFTCGKVVAPVYEEFTKRYDEYKNTYQREYYDVGFNNLYMTLFLSYIF